MIGQEYHKALSRHWRRLVVAAIVVFLLISCSGALFITLHFTNVFRALGFGRFGALDRARQTLEEGDLDAALYWANLAVERDGKFVEAYRMRGQVHEARGELSDAINDYSLAIQVAYGATACYIDRGRVYEKLGQLDAAARDYSRAILAHPSRDGPMNLAQRRAMRSGPSTLDEFITFFDKAIARDPDNKNLRKCREILYQGDWNSP